LKKSNLCKFYGSTLLNCT